MATNRNKYLKSIFYNICNVSIDYMMHCMICNTLYICMHINAYKNGEYVFVCMCVSAYMYVH